ncbi:MAG: valine--tRNA ligase [Candidatus Omnitrophica bacterium]|nr:valine--tRNA ligase [Candidatus Omnitrophota bacterium]
MAQELSKQYNPKETEDKWYKIWEQNNLFSAKVSPDKLPYCIVIPPPNVTGILHMGHALNNSIQDILIRYKRMRGFEALWMPGTDHAGIATQNVVEKSLAKEGIKRQDLGREKFIERVWQWKEQYGSTIIHQLKKLGCSCDWKRLRFTMDQDYSAAVTEVFVRLYEKKLIYQGNYIINWCPRCQTALSDEEAAHAELQGSLYYLKYPLKDNPLEFISVATTRPETMLGDTAVAVNPKDKRYKKYIGKTLLLPLIKREIKIIADSSVDMEFGTGAVKVTPAHDPNDYALGKKHNLEFINVMAPDGSMNEAAKKYSGLDRFKAREAVLEDLKQLGLLEKIAPHTLSAGHCYRCHTIVEPYLSKQWFVKMKPLARLAIEAVKKGRIKFYPERWTKVYLNWMENIQDWCISRQIWWGHRIPVYYCKNCQGKNSKYGIIVSAAKPAQCPRCKSTGLVQEEDVLDTWFSSWLWPFATFYWPQQLSNNQKPETRNQKTDLNYFYPTSALVTAPEIIFFWVARMIMAGFEFMGEAPFKDVYIHGTVRDVEGKKMSKSLGNVIDPLEIIAEYGTDALRFSLISITSQGQDVFLSKERFEQGRNFANKIWNASRFVLTNLKPEEVNVDLCVFFRKEQLDIANRWILSRFYSTLDKAAKELDSYKFNEAANTLYSFFWHEFCDWYLELIKPQINQKQTQVVMYKVLEKTLRIIHPFMPFITEEIWQRLPGAKNSIMQQSWPHLQKDLINSEDERRMQAAFDIINTVRNMRAELEVNPQSRINIKLAFANKLAQNSMEPLFDHIKNLAKINNLSVNEKYTVQNNEYVVLLKDIHIAMPLAGIAEVSEQIKKNRLKIEKLESEIKNKEAMLSNKNFTERAPKEIVEAEKSKLNDMRAQIAKLEVIINGLR